ncbi:hypothetical protein T439DRAFT_357058 [Meredithblackwellia eburnea MCA 4105]
MGRKSKKERKTGKTDEERGDWVKIHRNMLKGTAGFAGACQVAEAVFIVVGIPMGYIKVKTYAVRSQLLGHSLPLCYDLTNGAYLGWLCWILFKLKKRRKNHLNLTLTLLPVSVASLTALIIFLWAMGSTAMGSTFWIAFCVGLLAQGSTFLFAYLAIMHHVFDSEEAHQELLHKGDGDDGAGSQSDDTDNTDFSDGGSKGTKKDKKKKKKKEGNSEGDDDLGQSDSDGGDEEQTDSGVESPPPKKGTRGAGSSKHGRQ